ncbi:SDR family oxidoreductase [Rhizobium vallis]|uniref:SDR family oxidoreductase n=1 Tax=Rhizobium vallis TaxID=634290 RepID=A0A432PIR8_9HYPH|nr:SDR family oxidoreductase [Rhizobium vallis]RUM24148.1 SDR family oxidoreductase [Rhizobium vallis]
MIDAKTGNEASLAVITGGASGIGEATARGFVAAGWRVVIADINDERGDNIAAELAGRGSQVTYSHLDVSDEQAVLDFKQDVYSRFGRVDALVNSGGILQNATRVTKMAIADFDRIIDVNLRGTLLTARAFGEEMAAAGSGSIVNLCSLTTFQATPQPAYGMSKSALKMLTEVMAAELGPQGVRVNAVAPGYTMTPAMKQRIDRGERDPAKVISKSALRRFVEPKEIADAILFLCSPSASAITGVTLPIDCGWLVYSVYSSAAAQPE